jgi:hypothetical protein
MSHTTTIGNFSVQSIDFEVPQGDTISSVQPIATLILVPDSGYQIDANDFFYISGPSQVASAVFTQSGNNVICIVTFDTNYVMPGNDVDIPICISGNATPLQYSLSGVVELIADSHVTPLSGNTAYSAAGGNGEIVQAFTFTVSADSGYFFSSAPQGAITTGVVADYSITSSNVYDSNGNLTSVTFTGNYTFGSNNVTGNVFTVIANVKEIPVLVREITSYSINTSNLSGNFNTTRNMKIYGSPGALFSLTVVNEDGTSILGSTLSNVVIPLSGVYSFNITFPAVTDNDHYDFVLTGNLATTFDTPSGQPSIFTINQYLDITVSYGLTSTDPNLSLPSNISYTYHPLEELEPGDSNYAFQLIFQVTSGSEITVGTPPLPSDFSNTDPLNNGGTDINIESVITELSANSQILTITVDGFVLETGVDNVLSQLNLDSFVQTNRPPTAANVIKTIVEDEINPSNLVIQLLGSDLNGDSLVYSITSLPLNGDIYAPTDTTFQTPLGTGLLLSGWSSVLYKPDANFDGVDDFTYKVNDGEVDSNVASVFITVTPINDAPIITSTAPQFIGVAGGTYIYNFTYSDVDHTYPEVTISTQSSLPVGWTLTDNQNGTGTLTGPVPAGLTTIVLIATDPLGTSDSETINVSAAYDILTKMEFVVSYRSTPISASVATGQSPKTTSAINLSAKPSGVAGHSCNDADFILLAETQDSNNNTIRFIIGRSALNNTGTTQANSTSFNLTDAAWQLVTLPLFSNRTTSGSDTVPNNFIDINSDVYDESNLVQSPYSASNPQTYYVSGAISNIDRKNYFTINNTLAAQMAAATATGVFTLRLSLDSFSLVSGTYYAWAHAESAWLQVFKENSAGTNQEEVLDSNGNSFGVTSASNVSINIFTGAVTVT